LKVVYLGHVVSEEGIEADPKKLEAVQKYPTPTDVKSLWSFLGLASYYRKFIPHFSKIAGPLHNLTKKNMDYIWTSHCQNAFDTLKGLLTAAPVLAFPDFEQAFILETDASIQGLGAVLAQRQADGTVRPVSYANCSLQNHKKYYSITELEELAAVWAIKHF